MKWVIDEVGQHLSIEPESIILILLHLVGPDLGHFSIFPHRLQAKMVNMPQKHKSIFSLELSDSFQKYFRDRIYSI